VEAVWEGLLTGFLRILAIHPFFLNPHSSLDLTTIIFISNFITPTQEEKERERNFLNP
jgi:hypothetical protein